MIILMNVLLGMYLASGVIGVGYTMQENYQSYGIYWWDLDFHNPFHWMVPINVGSGFLLLASVITWGLTT